MTIESEREARPSSLFSVGENHPLRQLDFDRVLAIVMLEARTERGRELIASLSPTPDHALAERRQTRLAEMRALIAGGGLLPFSGLEEVPDDEEREEGGLADAWQILRAIRATAELRDLIAKSDEELEELQSIAARIPDLSGLVADTSRYFDREGRLREDATPELRKLRKQVISRRREAQATLEKLIGAHSSSVQDELVTMRADRYCIPVKSERRGAIPGILHERSGSGASVYIEPLEVVELNNDIAALSQAEREEIRRIERLIFSRIREHSTEIDAALATSAELDAIQAAALVANHLEATRPTFASDGTLRLLEARHPLLDPRIASHRRSAFGESDELEVVPTTIEIEPSRPGLVISGPNAGGKTVALKTAGLLVAMAGAGLPVPAADGSVIPVPDQVHILIGDEQDVLGHLSTFSGYLTRLKDVLARATARSLVLLDEIGSGTDPDEGSALAVAVTEHLLDTGCLFILTTHLGRVQSFAIAEERIVNASMEFEETSHSPTFRLVRDLPGRSRALEVARSVGLPPTIVERAREIAGDGSAAADELLNQLQKTIESNRAVSHDLEQRMATLQARERELDELIAKVRAEKRALAKEWKSESDELRREVRRRLREEIERLRTEARSGVDRSEVAKVSAEILGASEERISNLVDSTGEVAGDLREGGHARHVTFGFEGEIASIEGDRVELLVRGKRMKTRRDELEPIAPPSNSDAVPATVRSGHGEVAEPVAERAVELELNLIGQRVEEALDESEVFIDHAIRDGKRTIRIIHGHGTGRLRDAVREWLSSHPAVATHRPGKPREGGNGATIATLR